MKKIKEKINEILSCVQLGEELILGEVEQLAGDASSRTYYRISFQNTNKKMIACFEGESCKGVHDRFLKTAKEFERAGLKVPSIYHYNKTEKVLLQEDVGSKTLLSYLGSRCLPRSETNELEVYEDLVEDLIKLHNLEVENIDSEISSLSFDYKKLFSEMLITQEYFFQDYLGLKKEDCRLKNVMNELGRICRRLGEKKKVLVHRDFHTKNIMLTCEGDISYIDFQDARLGLPQYDIASILEDCYYSIGLPSKKKLLKKYWRESERVKKLYTSEEEFHRDYLESAIQRIIKALGSFAMISAKKNNNTYLKHVSLGVENLKPLLDEYLEFDKSSFVLDLMDIYYEN